MTNLCRSFCFALLFTALMAGSSLAGEAPAKRFSLVKSHAATSVGKHTTTKVKVDVSKGWKWNDKYPAKLTFKNVPATLDLKKTKFSQLKGDFKSDKAWASVNVDLGGKTAGNTLLSGELKFSVCNETTCVIEKAAVTVEVSVAP